MHKRLVLHAWAHPRPCIGLPAATLLRHRLGGGAEERVHLHVLPLELRPADVAARAVYEGYTYKY